MGILHVRGKATWRPYEQAGYLYRQSVDFRKSPAELAEQIGCSEAEIKNSIEAYKMMDAAEVRDPEKFSYFVEYKKSRKMTDAEQFLRRDENLDNLFVGWVKDEVIPRAERVRDIPIILNDKKARRGFLDRRLSFDDAVELAKERHPETESTFYSKLKRATAALEAAEPLRVQEEVEADSGKKHILEQLCKTIVRFCRDVGIQVSAINRIHKSGKPRP